MRRNQANQIYGFGAFQVDGTPVTAGVTGQRKLDGAAAAAITGSLAHTGAGWWEYTTSAADTDGEFVLLNFSGGSMVPVSMNFDTRPVETTGSIGGGTIEGQWRFNTSTAAADPGSGRVGFNSATYASVTAVYISEVTNSNFNMSDVFGALVTGDRFLLARDSDGSVFIRLTLTGSLIDNGGWWTIPVSYVEHAGSFGNNNVLRGTFFVERGLTAAEIAQLRYRLQMDGSQVAPAANAPTQLRVSADAWDGVEAAVKNGPSSGLPQMAVEAWQDEVLPAGAKMIENDGSNNGRWTIKALEQAPSGGGGGLTSQEVRDAMKLAPTAGAPSAGSIDDHLDSLDVTKLTTARAGNLDNLDATVSSRSSHSAADVWGHSTRALTDKEGFSLAPNQTGVTIGTVQVCEANTDMRGTDNASTHNVAAVWAGMTDAAANKQADHVLRRGYGAARTSGDGDAVAGRSLLGMVARGVNKQRLNNGTGRAEFYHEDDATIFFQQAYTVDATASLITELDTV